MIDSSRFLQIYDQYSGLILSYAVRRTRNVDDAADVLIEAYTVAWRRNYDMPSGKEARPWLYGIARRVMANQHRTVERRTRLDLELRSSATNAFVDPTAVGPDREDASAALECLSFDDRELLMLSAWDGLDSRDLAIVLGCSPGMARVRLRRARRRFEQHFAKELDEQ